MTPHEDHLSRDHGRHLHAAPESAGGQVVSLYSITGKATDPDAPAAPMVPRWLAAAENRSVLLDHHRLAASLTYACTGWRLPRAALYWAWQGTRGCAREITYPVTGAGKVADAIYGWTVALDHERAAQVALGSSHAYRAAERHVNAKTWRKRILAVAACAVAVLGLWLGLAHPWIGILTLIGLVGVLDVIGRRGRPKPEAPPAAPRPLIEGMPTHLLQLELQAVLEEEDYATLITISDVILDLTRHEYHVAITTHAEVKPELLRQIERRINAPANSIRMRIDPQNSASRVLSIRTGNPLANVPELPWIPYGEVSAWDSLPLGASANPDAPYELIFAGQHTSIIGATGSAKTTVHMNNSIDRLSACYDAVQWGITLDKKSNFAAWRSVLSATAFSVREAFDLLTLGNAEIDRRDGILTRLAEDDDPTNDQSEWSSDLGPALIIWIDEFPQIAQWDGTKLDENGDKPNLLVLVERLLRLGRGLGISTNIAAQATGNNDTGSSIVAKQTTTKIVGPCSMADTLAVFGKDKRDQGYAPHLLEPAKLGGSHNDAGMAVIDGSGFGPEYVRGGKPFRVKERAMRREREWEAAGTRPFIETDTEPDQAAALTAVTVPSGLAAVDAALAHHSADVLSSEVVIKHANSHGAEWTQSTLAKTLAAESPVAPVAPRSGRCRVLRVVRQSYYRDDVARALRALELGS